jgi:hypothetical protein
VWSVPCIPVAVLALDHLAIGLVANKYTKLGKTSETFLLSQGLSYIKIPLCYSVLNTSKAAFLLPLRRVYLDLRYISQNKQKEC